MANLLETSYTDPDFEDLIEKAFPDGQVDGAKPSWLFRGSWVRQKRPAPKCSTATDFF
jgi:hypothetical protein